MANRRIYVDHAATAPLDPEVIEKMVDVMTNHFGNPSSIHSFGRESRQLLDEARALVAQAIGAKEREIVFTSGGTEANNMALFGVAKAHEKKGRHIITTAIEHHAVLHTCQQLEREGFEVTYLPVDETGRLSLSDFKAALRQDTILVSIMYGNNEVGTIQPVKEIGELLENHPAIFHCDAVQAFGYERVDLQTLPVDLLSVSGHKINGPKGSGFLYVRSGIQLKPLQFGGEQERKRRAGTENVAAIVGLAEAVRISEQRRVKQRGNLLRWKKAFLQQLTEKNIDYEINGDLKQSLPHILNVSFKGVDVEAMLVHLDLAGVAASSGSACTAGSIVTSHVLLAMHGEKAARLKGAIRFSFGIANSEEQIEQLSSRVATIVDRLTTT